MTPQSHAIGVEETAGARRGVSVVLAGAAGLTDAAGFLALDLFTAHMSGNSARLGVYLGGGLLLRAAPSAFALLVFVASIAAGMVVIEILARSGRRSPAVIVLGVEMAMLLVLAFAGEAAAVGGRVPPNPAGVYYSLSALAVGAMGLQTSTLQRVSGRTVRTTYVSGMLTTLVDEAVVLLLARAGRGRPTSHSYLRDELGLQPGPETRRRIRLIIGIWSAYVSGAVLGGFLERRIHLLALVVPAALIAAVIGFDVFDRRVRPVSGVRGPKARVPAGRSPATTGGNTMVHVVGDVMTPEPLCMDADTPVTVAAMAMRDAGIGDVIVRDSDRLCGIVTDRDITIRAVANRLPPETTDLGAICSRDLTVVSPDAPIAEAARLMASKALRRIPVVDHGRPVGIVSLADIGRDDLDEVLTAISDAPPNR